MSFRAGLLFLKSVLNEFYLFGSVLTDRFDENIDIDLLVSFEDFTQGPLERSENSWNPDGGSDKPRWTWTEPRGCF